MFRNPTLAFLADQHILDAKLQAMKSADVSLAKALHDLKISMGDWSTAQARVQFLSGDRSRCNRHVDSNCARRAHRVSRIADEQETILRPIIDEPDQPLERKERREVLQAARKLVEDGIELTHATGHEPNAFLPPSSPFTGPQRDTGLNVVRVLGSIKPRTLLPSET